MRRILMLNINMNFSGDFLRDTACSNDELFTIYISSRAFIFQPAAATYHQSVLELLGIISQPAAAPSVVMDYLSRWVISFSQSAAAPSFVMRWII
jgi:hypothetical protein